MCYSDLRHMLNFLLRGWVRSTSTIAVLSEFQVCYIQVEKFCPNHAKFHHQKGFLVILQHFPIRDDALEE